MFIVVFLLLCLGMGMAQPAAAQAGGSQQIVTGETVSWDAEWSYDADVSVRELELEILALSRATSIVAYGSTTFAVPGSTMREVALEGYATEATLTQIDRGDYDNVSYSIDIATMPDGTEIAVFTLVFERQSSTSIAMQISDPRFFQSDMEAAQRGVTVDGSPLFNGVDAPVMQATVDATVNGSSQQPIPSPTPAIPAPETPTPMVESGSGGGNSGLAGPRDRRSGPQSASSGAATLSTVTLPSNGAVISHSSDWVVDEEFPDSIGLATAASPAAYVRFLDIGPQVGDVDATVFAQSLLQDPGFAQSELVDAVNGPDGHKVIVFRERDSLGSILMIYAFTIDAEAMTIVQLTIFEDDLSAVLPFVTGSLMLDGVPLFDGVGAFVPSLNVPGS